MVNNQYRENTDGKNLVRTNFRLMIFLIIIIVLLVNIIVASYPVLNDFQGVTVSINPPKYYSYTNEFLDSQHENSSNYFRVMWLPTTEYPFYLDVNWSPHPYLTPDPRIWISSVPVYEYGSSPYYYVMYQLIRNNLEHSSYDMMGHLLSLLDIKYIVYQQNTIDPQKYVKIFEGLSYQRDLKLVKTFGPLVIYKNFFNSSYLGYSNKVILALCPLDGLLILIKNGLNPQRTPVIFLEQTHLDFNTLKNILEQTNSTLVICYPKTLNDIILDLINSKNKVHLIEYKGWGLHFINCPHWIPFYMEKIHRNIYGWHYDLTMDENILVTTHRNAVVKFKFTIDKAGEYLIWIRAIRSKYTGKMEIKIDGKIVGFVNNSSSWLQGFKWIKVTQMRFSRGSHIMEIINLKGKFQAINMIKIVNVEEYKSFANEIRAMLKDKLKNTVFVYPTINGNYIMFQKNDILFLFNSSVRKGNFTSYGLSRSNHVGNVAKPKWHEFDLSGTRVLRIVVTKGGKYERWSLLFRLNHYVNITNYKYLYIRLYGKSNGQRFYIRLHSPRGFYSFIFSMKNSTWQELVIPITLMKPFGNPSYSRISEIEISPVGINISGIWFVSQIGFIKNFNFSSIYAGFKIRNLNYTRLSGTKIIVFANNISNGIIFFSEAYDDNWEICGCGHCTNVIPINFVEQGGIISGNICNSFTIKYVAEDQFNYGKDITVITLVTLTFIILYLNIGSNRNIERDTNE